MDFDKSFVYDPASNRKEAHDAGSSETVYYSYDLANLLSGTEQLPTADTFEFDWEYPSGDVRLGVLSTSA